MKNTLYLLIATLIILSCRTNNNILTSKRNYNFLTDSLKINQQLEKYKLPGFSLVVFENYKIVYSNQFGLKSVDSKEKNNEKTKEQEKINKTTDKNSETLAQQLTEKLAQDLKSALDTEEKVELHEFLHKSLDVFAKNTMSPGIGHVPAHRIETGDSCPIRQRYYSRSPKENLIIRDTIDQMLANGIAVPSQSEWSSPIVLVRKKDGSLRFCVDYRKLNSVTLRDSYPLPRMRDLFDKLCGAKYFTLLDLASGFWQIPMFTADKHKTAFISQYGLFEFNVMPFGLLNAPMTFQRVMDVLLTGVEWDFV